MSCENKIGSQISDNQWKPQEIVSHYVHQVWTATRLSMRNVSGLFSASGKNLYGQHFESNFMATCVVGSNRRKWRFLAGLMVLLIIIIFFPPYCCKSIVVHKSNVFHFGSSCKTLTKLFSFPRNPSIVTFVKDMAVKLVGVTLSRWIEQKEVMTPEQVYMVLLIIIIFFFLLL